MINGHVGGEGSGSGGGASQFKCAMLRCAALRCTAAVAALLQEGVWVLLGCGGTGGFRLGRGRKSYQLPRLLLLLLVVVLLSVS